MAHFRLGAQPYYALQYKGGPAPENFTIYPLYYGAWSPKRKTLNSDSGCERVHGTRLGSDI
jgi:hypothetical protein